MSRILAIDLGEQRIGLALSDPTGNIAGGIRTIRRGLRDEEMAALRTVIATQGVERIIVGMPLGMNGLPGVQAELTRRWVEALRRNTDLPVEILDERLTTVQAHRSLDSLGVRRRQHRQHVDGVAATLLLQSYLDAHREDT
ncbi:MAG TPA: Holliday junction resolvase RuvX [Chloroflexota bacterium]